METVIEKRIDKLEKVVINGNEHEPLTVVVSRIDERQKAMNNTLDKLALNVTGLTTTVSALIKTNEFMKGVDKGAERAKKKNRWIIGVLAGAIVGLLAALIKII